MFTSLFQLEKKPVTVFSSADTGAPTLTTDAGSLKTLLKACLVTGYGDKQALGWEMLYETDDLSGAVFKSADPTASKFCLKVDNSTSDVKLSAYQSMTAFDTGDKSMVVDNIYKVQECNWRLIGHSKAFILLLDYHLDFHNVKVAYPLVFGNLPRQTKRLEPVCVLWNALSYGSYESLGGLQSTLFYWQNGRKNNSTGISAANSYPFVVSDGQAGASLTKNYCRFDYESHATSAVLYEPVLLNLPDSTWSLLPMLQPLSTRLTDVANLGQITDNSIKATTGYYGSSDVNDNLDCAVPTDWWYA